ncbi:hypothetical protein HK104_010735, partial [Borealophlyctis nickersoniae]
MEQHTDVLFEKSVPVILKHPTTAGGTAAGALHVGAPTVGGLVGARPQLPSPQSAGDQFKEKRHPGITVQVAMTKKNGGRLKVLEIQLTDESDPFFLYQLDIGEDDFHTLRTEQNLLVDFQQFPLKFIELLEECLGGRADEHAKFIARLTSDPSSRLAIFSIIETNSFKHITHLSLQFVPGNDAAVKQYLANLVKEYKAENASLYTQLNTTTTTLSTKLRESETLSSKLGTELDQIKLVHSEQMSRLQLRHAEEISQEKERFGREREEQRLNHEKEKRDIELNYEEQVKSLSQKLTSVNTTHSHTLSHAQNLETQLSAANKQIESLTRELFSVRQEAERSGATGRQLDRARGELEAECASLRERVRDLERKEREREEAARRAEEALRSANEHKAKIEDALDLYKTQNARLEESMKKATEEINKGNDIIRRLQADLKASKSKAKLKNVVTMQQEKLLDERAVAIDALQKEINEIKEALGKKEAECEECKSRIEALEKRIEEGKAIIEDNNHVIEWLHKQLNEEALHRPIASIGTGVDFDRYGTDYKRTSPTGYRSRYRPPTTAGEQPEDTVAYGIPSAPTAAQLKYNPAAEA